MKEYRVSKTSRVKIKQKMDYTLSQSLFGITYRASTLDTVTSPTPLVDSPKPLVNSPTLLFVTRFVTLKALFMPPLKTKLKSIFQCMVEEVIQGVSSRRSCKTRITQSYPRTMKAISIEGIEISKLKIILRPRCDISPFLLTLIRILFRHVLNKSNAKICYLLCA